MYLESKELLNEIEKITKEIYDKTNGAVLFEEYIALPYYGNIILRFELNKEEYSINDLDKYETLMNEIVDNKFLIDFMGSVYKKVGLNIQELNQILPKCYEKYKNEEITKSIYENKIKQDVHYLLELGGLPKTLNVWEIQLEEEINILLLGDSFKESTTYYIKDKKVNVYEINKKECEGLMKAIMHAKKEHISLVRALLEA